MGCAYYFFYFCYALKKNSSLEKKRWKLTLSGRSLWFCFVLLHNRQRCDSFDMKGQISVSVFPVVDSMNNKLHHYGNSNTLRYVHSVEIKQKYNFRTQCIMYIKATHLVCIFCISVRMYEISTPRKSILYRYVNAMAVWIFFIWN